MLFGCWWEHVLYGWKGFSTMNHTSVWLKSRPVTMSFWRRFWNLTKHHTVVEQVWTSMKTRPDIHQTNARMKKKGKSLSHVRLFATPWNSPCWNTGVGNLSFLQNASMRVWMKTQIHRSMSNTLKKKKKEKSGKKKSSPVF